MRLIITVLLGLSVIACTANNSVKDANKPATEDKAAENKGIVVENPYTRTYVSRNIPQSALQQNSATPKLFLGKNKEDDEQSMLENGLDLIGYSSFEAGNVPPEQLTQQAKKVHAEIALVYTELTAEPPASVKIQQMKEQQRLQANPELAKMGKLLPPQQSNYSYFASYWAKLLPPIIGVHVKGIAQGAVAEGLEVKAVIRASPADMAGLQAGDLIKRIGDIEMRSPEALNDAAKRYAGKNTLIEYMRDGQLSKVMTIFNNHL